MPWGNKQPDLKNDPTYLEPRVTAVESSLADKATKKQLPIDITDYGAVGDGVTDCLSAYNTAISGTTSDATGRIQNASLNVDLNGDGIADNWTSYQDSTITGSANMTTDGQQLTISASTGAGGQGVFQTFSSIPGETLTIGVTYKSANAIGSFIPYVVIYPASGGSPISFFELANSASYTTVNNLQITVPNGVTSVKLYFMARAKTSGDTGSITIKNVTLSSVSMPSKVVKFPQNSFGNAVYYFSSNPDLTKAIIDSDEGVTLSFPTTNSISFKSVTFKNNIGIISRDRNNTGTQQTNKYSKLLFASLSDNELGIGMKKPISLQDSDIFKKNYYTSVTASSTADIVNDATYNLYQVNNPTTLTENGGQLISTLFSYTKGDLLSACFRFIQPESYAGFRVGVMAVADDGNLAFYSFDKGKVAYNGLKNNNTWTETSKNLSTKLTDAYSFSHSFILGIRALSGNQFEVLLNGVVIDRVTTSFNFTQIGFAINCIQRTNSGINNCRWGDFVKENTEKLNYGDSLNIAVFGDSITFGEGAISWAEYLPTFLEGQRGINKVTITNKAVSGQNSAQQLTAMQNLDLSPFDTVLILIGTNDIQQVVTSATFTTNVQSMITLANANNRKVILGVPPVFISQSLTGQGFADYNYEKGGHIRARVMRLCADNGIWLADTMSEIGRIGTDNVLNVLRDNLHPNTFGQVLLARCFARTIIQSLMPKIDVSLASVTPSLQNGWVAFGGGYQSPRIYKDNDGLVHIEGMIKSGTTTSATVIFPLPKGYIPSSIHMFLLACNDGTGLKNCTVEVNSSGNVVCSLNVANNWLSLEGIKYKV